MSAAAPAGREGAEIHQFPIPTRWDVERAVRSTRDLDGPAKCVMYALLTSTDNGTTVIPPEFSPSLAGLVLATGHPKSVVALRLNSLEAKGWLTRERPSTAKAIKDRATTVYRPQLPPNLSVTRTSPSGGLVRHTDDPPSATRTGRNRARDKTAGPDPSVTRTSPSGGHNQNKTSRTSSRTNTRRPAADYDDPQFAEFWETYPKRAGKRAAWKQWLSAVKRADPAEIITGAKRYAEQLADDGTDPKYIKDPSGWLSADRWADEVPAARRRPAHGHVPYQDAEDQSAYLQSMFPDEEHTP